LDMLEVQNVTRTYSQDAFVRRVRVFDVLRRRR
jgi:hypothetical protein